MSWKKIQFKDVVQFPPKVSLEKDEIYSFIPMEDLTSGIKYVNPKTDKKWSGNGGAKFEEGDTLFARITPCLQNGKIAQAKGLKNGKGFGSTEYFIFRGKEGVTDSDFVYYLSLNEEFKKNAIGSMVGASGRQRADQKFVGEYEINLPPLQTQKRIASILSAYDDLIENNLKRIKLLEETAQNIYKEWFVNFRFPNYENTPFNEETGLPEGWEMKTIMDFGNVITGKTPSTSNPNFYGGNIPFIKTPDMHDTPYVLDTSITLTIEGAETQNNKFLPKNSVLVSCIGTAGVVALTSEISQSNQQINGVTFNKEYKSFYFYGFAKGLKPLLEGLGSNGATMVNVNKSKFENIPIVIPKSSILIKYHENIKSLFEQILILQQQNQKLKEARDILLPRLMNRTIEV